MRRSISLVLTSALFALSFQLSSSAAQAAPGPDACQNIEFGADTKCEVVVSGGCTAKCEPVSFELSCAAELHVGCDGMCNLSATVDCQASCGASCQAECMVDPPKYDCNVSCQADCSANCDTRCAANPDKAQCTASCKSTCSGDCSAKCTGTPGTATCDAKCKASCDGSCTADVNADCEVMCQATGFAKCETDLKGGCEAQCSKPDGALFCDGQYIDTRDRLKDCLEYLESTLQIDVQGYARGDANCSGGTCTATGEAGVSCSASPAGARSAPVDAGALAPAVVGAGVMVARRRRAAR